MSCPAAGAPVVSLPPPPYQKTPRPSNCPRADAGLTILASFNTAAAAAAYALAVTYFLGPAACHQRLQTVFSVFSWEAQQLFLTMSSKLVWQLQEHWRQLQQLDGNSDSQGLQSSSNVFIGCLGSLQHLFTSSCHAAASQLNPDAQSMLLGQPLLAAAHLVSEPAMWTCLFLTCWQHMFATKRQGTKSKGDAASNGQAHSNAPDAIVHQMLAKLLQTYTAGLQSVLDAINSHLKVSAKSQVAAATELALGGQGDASPSVADMLEGCLSHKDVNYILTAIVDNQKLTLKRIKLHVSELLSAV